MVIDLVNVSLPDFARFLFDRPAPQLPTSSEDEPEPWYWSAEVSFEAAHIADLYVALFSQANELLTGFTDDQLDRGFWAVHGSNLECSAGNLIWETEVPFHKRAEVVRSMRHVFAGLLAARPLDTATDMWWDSLAYDWHCGNRARSNGGEDADMQDVMFQTLCDILGSPAEHIQYAALHGLGHLHHPDTELAVSRWLSAQAVISEDLRSYAEAATRFEVM